MQPPKSRSAERGVAPDAILFLAVAAITFVPATLGLSLALAPVAWGWGAFEARRRRRRGETSGERIDAALVVGGFVSVLAGGPLLVGVAYYFVRALT